jgi:serum/glucocorticoid-regulated kinase 2
VLYRDLKPENIVVDFRGHLVVADFGLSKCGFQEQQEANSYCGSPEYMAPEMITRHPYNYSVDFYTLGAILYEFVTGLPPFYSSNQDKIMNKIVTKKLDIP